MQIACSKWSTACPAPNGRAVASDLQANWNMHADKPMVMDPLSSNMDIERQVSVEEWESLEGRDLFGKFSTLLALLYPSSKKSML